MPDKLDKFALFDQQFTDTIGSEDSTSPKDKFAIFDQQLNESTPTQNIDDSTPTTDSQSEQQNVNEQKPELSYVDRLLQVARGVGNIPTSILDLTNRFPGYYGAAALEKGLGAVGLDSAAEAVKKQKEKYGQSNLTEQLHNVVKENYKDLTPTDTLGRTLEATGEFLSPISKVKIAGQGAKALADAGTRHLAKSAGAATAVEATRDSKVFDEKNSPFLSAAEDIVKSIFGSSLGNKTVSVAQKQILKNAGNDLEKLAARSEKLTLKQKAKDQVGKALSKFSDIDKEVIDAAKSENINLPFNVALNGTPQNFLSNAYLKNLFVSKQYKNVINNADEDMIKAVTSKINSVHPENLVDSISDTTRSFLKEEKNAISKEQRALYDHANSLIKDGDKVSIQPFVEKADKILSMISDSPSKPKALVYSHIMDIYNKWGIIDKSSQRLLKDLDAMANQGVKIPQSTIDQIKKISSERKILDVDVKKIDQLRHDWNDIYDPFSGDFTTQFGSLTKSLKNTLEQSKNKEYLDALFKADKFHATEVAGRIKTDMAMSIMNGEVPKEALKYMTDVPNIKQLSKILGDSPKAQEIMQALKRSKLEQIFTDRAKDSSGNLKYGVVANLLNNRSMNQPLLKELLGQKNYNDLKKLAKISIAFSKSGKELANPSGTAFTSQSLNTFKDIAKVTASALVLPVSGAYIAGTGGAAMGAMATSVLPYLVSKAVSDPEIVNAAIKYALASKSGNVKKADKFLDRIGYLMSKAMPNGLPVALTQAQESTSPQLTD
jgi:hypothetical protein